MLDMMNARHKGAETMTFTKRRLVVDQDGKRIGRITSQPGNHHAYSERGVFIAVFDRMNEAYQAVVNRWNRYEPQGW